MTVQRLRPIESVFQQGIIACIAFMIPVFIVLYAMSVPSGPWLVVLATQLVITSAILFASWRFFRLGVWVSSDSIAETGFFRGNRTFTRHQIGSMVFAQAYSGTEVLPQLFVRGTNGELLVRMRGQFWTRESMDRVMETLDARLEIIDEPLSVAELRASEPALLYWFERHPAIAGLAFAAGLTALGVIALVVLRLTGVWG